MEEAIMSSEKIPYKIYLNETEMPEAWYNLRADMKKKPAPLLNPSSHLPMKADELAGVFCEELVKQELDDTTPYFRIPEEIRNFYKMYRPSPWFGRIVWRRSWVLLQRSITNLRATIPAAATS